MTQYISSFLIEPIVQHARRFSQSSNSSAAPPTRSRDLLRDPSDPPYDEENVSAEVLSLGHGGVYPARPTTLQVIADDTTASLIAEDTNNDGIIQRHYPEGSGPDPGLSEPETLQLDEGISDNPSHSVRDRIQTSSGSANSSVDSTMSHPRRRTYIMPASRTTTGRINSQRTGADALRRKVKNPLPADDGMRDLRSRIHSIQSSTGSNEEKARLMHALMTQAYTLAQPLSPNPSDSSEPRLLRRPSNIERPLTPISQCSSRINTHPESPPTPLSFEASPLLVVTAEDKAPTYYQHPKPKKTASSVGPLTSARGSNTSLSCEAHTIIPSSTLGCKHYKRNIKLQCSTCSKWYTCRFCHDEVEDHHLVRRETKHMLCMLCGCAQRAAESCAECGQRAAWYYCDVCKLWDDDTEKNIYHCEECGICRIGVGLGKDFYHCKVCQACISISIQHTHKCIERSTDCDCPICGEYMFTSPETVVFMKCGHSIHHRCYYAHLKTSYRCPICNKSLANMETQFRQLQDDINGQPMPPEFEDTKAWISCNDCSAKSTVKYHWIGLKCATCDSFNTAQLRLFHDQEPPSQPEQPQEVSILDTGSQWRLPDLASTSDLIPRPTDSRMNTAPSLLERFGGPSSMPSQLPSFSFLTRDFRASSPLAATRWPREASPADSLDGDIEMTDTDHEYEEEVDFWGGESPRIRPRSADAEINHPRRDIGDHDNDDDDDDDDDYDDVDDDMDYTSSEDEEEETDQMEIMGHR